MLDSPRRGPVVFLLQRPAGPSNDQVLVEVPVLEEALIGPHCRDFLRWHLRLDKNGYGGTVQAAHLISPGG